jgi:hypothetical protein
MVKPIAASFRDNDGFVFKQEELYYRAIMKSYEQHYTHLMGSGLYNDLVQKNRLIPHQEVDLNSFKFDGNQPIKILLPNQINFISYPYEWSFNMWQDAAIVTLKIALQALEFEMYLKDATPFNIQFADGRPIFIDTLSFEKYEAGKPWIAYRQFCESFLAPLLLMHYCDNGIAKIFATFANGIPLDTVKNLLPIQSKFNWQVYLHIYLHSKKSKESKVDKAEQNFTKKKLALLLQSLLDLVKSLTSKKAKTTWDDYYAETILSKQYLASKKELLLSFTKELYFNNVVDLGANDGAFSILLKDKANQIIALDGDVNCINNLYKHIRKEKITNIVPLYTALTMPSPAIGWANKERNSLTERLKSDLVLALALVHHLAIACNVSLQLIAEWLTPMANYLVIEFVPKSDDKVKLLLHNREDIFEDYTQSNFEIIFSRFYNIVKSETVATTERKLYLMQRK